MADAGWTWNPKLREQIDRATNAATRFVEALDGCVSVEIGAQTLTPQEARDLGQQLLRALRRLATRPPSTPRRAGRRGGRGEGVGGGGG